VMRPRMYGPLCLRVYPRRGFALISAMWLIVTIAAVALQFSLRAKERRFSVINVAESGQARAAAEAGVQTSIARLERMLRVATGLSSGSGSLIRNFDPWSDADSLCTDSVVIDNVSYTTYVRDAGSTVNVNNLSEEEWRNFIIGAGIDYDEADKLAQAISDWRDIDDDPRSRGSERDEYIRESALVLPANRDFASISDLSYVMGMTPDIYGKLVPHLRVAGGRQVNVNTAGVPVLRSLPGMTDEIVAVVQRTQASGTPIRSLQELTLLSGRRGRNLPGANQLRNRLVFATQELEVYATGKSANNHTSITLSVIVRRVRSQAQVIWRRYA
jgi:general secretion pathway protein K